MLQITKKRSYRSTVHPYYSTGIPGDYFECESNEAILVQKLETLRNSNLAEIPSLFADLESESLHSSEDDPDLFFDEQWSSDVEDDKMGHESAHLDENLVHHLDGELSVHSSHSCVSYQEIDPDEHDAPEDSIQQPLEMGLPSSSLPDPTAQTSHQKRSISSTSSKQLKPSQSLKSWEGSEIVLNESSFVIDSSVLRKLQQEMENCDLQDHFAKNGKDRQSPTSVRDYLSTSSPRSITNTKAVEQGNYDIKPGSTEPVTSSTSFIPEEANLDTYPVKVSGKKTSSEYQRAKIGIKTDFNTPKKESSFARRWSFSSSFAEEEENEEMDSFNPEPSYRPFSEVSSYKSHSRSRSSSTRSMGSSRHRPMSAKSTSSSVVSESLEKQELFLKLSDEEDLKDFKHINNFTYEGDYLFSRILRERTRIELKRQMLSTPDKELYVETAKSELTKRETESSCSESVYGDRSVYFMI